MIPGISRCLLAQLVLMLVASVSLKHRRYFKESKNTVFPFVQSEILSQSINRNPYRPLNHKILRRNHITSNPNLPFAHLFLFPSVSFSYGCVSSLSLGGPRHPCVAALWMPPWQMSTMSLFFFFLSLKRAFCTFNHVTLSRADYRRLSSLEKVRAGIRASWGIRSPNWFQLSLPPNDQFFSRTDGAVARTLERAVGPFFFSLSLSLFLSLLLFWNQQRLHAGQLQRDLKPLFNINHMVVPVVQAPCF